MTTATITPNRVVYGDGVKVTDAHRQFKERMIRVLHDEATRRSYCGDYDSVMIEAGLPGRRGVGYDAKAIKGERTKREFDAWRRRTGRFLALMGGRRSIPDYAEVLRRAGLGTKKVNVDLRIELVVQTSVDVMDDETVDEAIATLADDDKNAIHIRVNQAFAGGTVTWKASSAS